MAAAEAPLGPEHFVELDTPSLSSVPLEVLRLLRDHGSEVWSCGCTSEANRRADPERVRTYAADSNIHTADEFVANVRRFEGLGGKVSLLTHYDMENLPTPPLVVLREGDIVIPMCHEGVNRSQVMYRTLQAAGFFMNVQVPTAASASAAACASAAAAAAAASAAGAAALASTASSVAASSTAASSATASAAATSASVRLVAPHGAISGFDPFTSYSNLNDDNWIGYMHGEVLNPAEDTDITHQAFIQAFGEPRRRRVGGLFAALHRLRLNLSGDSSERALEDLADHRFRMRTFMGDTLYNPNFYKRQGARRVVIFAFMRAADVALSRFLEKPGVRFDFIHLIGLAQADTIKMAHVRGATDGANRNNYARAFREMFCRFARLVVPSVTRELLERPDLLGLRLPLWLTEVLVSRVVLALGETNATCDDGRLSCPVCEDEFRAVASLNVLSNLPRINARGDPVNRTLGEFDFVVCNDPDQRANTSNLTGCPLSSLEFNLDVLQADALGNAQSPSPAAYFQSVGMYVLAMFVCGAFVVVYGLLLALCRFGTDRCCGPLRCATLRLGLDAPTKRECCIGFRKDSKGDFAYPLWEVIFAYGLLVAFIISTMLFMVLSQAKGNAGLSTTLQQLTYVPRGLALLVHNASLEPADNFAEKIAGDVTAEFLLELEDVVSRSMSLANATTNTVCAIWSIERQPDVSITQTSVAAMEAHQLDLQRLLRVAEVEQLGVTPRKDAVRAAIDSLTATVDILVDAKPTMDDKLAFILPAIGEVANLQTLIQATGPSPTRAVTRRFFDLVEVFDRWFPRSNHVPFIRARLERVIAGDVDGEEHVNRTVRIDLLNAMDNMIRDYEALPSLEEMADTMQEFNDLVLTSIDSGVFRNVTDRIQAVHDYTESLPLPDEVMVVIQRTLGIGRAMDEGPALRSATAVRDSVRALPSFDALRADVHRVPLVFEGLPCLFEVARQATRMNETVIRVPLPVSSLVPLSLALNDSLASLNRNISTFDTALDVAEANVRALPIDALIADTQAWRADLTRNFLNLEVDRLQAEEIAFDQRRFFTPRVLLQYDEFRDTLNASLVPDSFITSVRAYEASRRAFTEFLRTETRRVRWYHGGTCRHNPTNICFTNSGSETVGANSTCPSDCRNIGTRRCETDLTIACPSNATVCPTGECIVDDTRLRLLIAAMEQMQSDRPVFQPIVRMFNTSINESTFPTQDLVDEVNDARRKFAAISGESFNQQLALSYRGLDVLDEFAGRQALITAREQIEPVPFPDLRRALDEARAVELDQDAVQEPKLLLVRNFFDALWYFFKDEVPRLVRVLRFVATTPAADAVETLAEVFQTFDFATRFLATRSEYLAETIEPTTTEANMGELLSRLSFAQSRHHIDLGPYYFLVRVLANSSHWISHADTLAHRYGFDITEAPYPGDRACITQECLDREVEYYNTWELRRASSGAVDLAISREALFGLPLLAPAILLAVTVYALVGDRFIKEPERRHIPASVFVGTTMVCAPFFFAVSGLLFGGTLIFADVCYSGEAAALRVLDVLGDTLCPDVVGGEGDYEHCIIRMNATEAFPLEVDLPLSELFRAAAGLCEGGRHPTETVLHSLGASMRHSPELYIRRALLDVFGDGSDTSFDLREPVREVFVRAGDRTGAFLVELMEEASEALHCEDVHEAFMAVKDPVCCHALDAAYWLVAPWVLMSFAMLLCAIPGGLLGRKRFPKIPWGPSWHTAIEEDLRVRRLGSEEHGIPAPVEPPPKVEEPVPFKPPPAPLQAADAVLTQRPGTASTAPTRPKTPGPTAPSPAPSSSPSAPPEAASAAPTPATSLVPPTGKPAHTSATVVPVYSSSLRAHTPAGNAAAMAAAFGLQGGQLAVSRPFTPSFRGEPTKRPS